MKFLIQEISPSKKEFRVTLNSTKINDVYYYIFGSNGGNFDQGSVTSEHIPLNLSTSSGLILEEPLE